MIQKLNLINMGITIKEPEGLHTDNQKADLPIGSILGLSNGEQKLLRSKLINGKTIHLYVDDILIPVICDL